MCIRDSKMKLHHSYASDSFCILRHQYSDWSVFCSRNDVVPILRAAAAKEKVATVQIHFAFIDATGTVTHGPDLTDNYFFDNMRQRCDSTGVQGNIGIIKKEDFHTGSEFKARRNAEEDQAEQKRLLARISDLEKSFAGSR